MEARAALLVAVILLAVVVMDAVHGNGYIPPRELTFIIATDLHYIAPELTDHGAYFRRVIENADGKVTQYAEELTEAFVEEVIAVKPDALVLSGDLTFNGAAVSHKRLAEKLERVADAGIPVYVLPGNHDLDYGMAAKFQGDEYELTDSVSAGDFEKIYGRFARGVLSRDEASFSYAVRLAPGLRLILADANTPDTPGKISDAALVWLEGQLKDAKKHRERVLTVSHQNLREHNSIFTGGFVMRNHETLEVLFQKYSVLCHLSGHMHIQHILTEDGVPEIVTSSLAVSPNQYGVITARYDPGTGWTVAYQSQTTDVAAWAARHGLTDSALLRFPDTAAAFFHDTALRQVHDVLEDDADALVEDELTALAEYFAEVSAAYFAGTMDTVSQNETLCKRWGELDEFFALYLNSMLQDAGKSMRGAVIVSG